LWSQALIRAALAGFITTMLVLIVPVPVLMLLLLPAGGGLCVWMYGKTVPTGSVTTGQGAVLGAITGFFSFLFYLIVLMATITFGKEKMMQAMKDAMQQSFANNPDPNAQKMLQQMMQYFSTPEGFAMILTMAIIVIFVFFIFLCMTGGAISAKLSRRTR